MEDRFRPPCVQALRAHAGRPVRQHLIGAPTRVRSLIKPSAGSSSNPPAIPIQNRQRRRHVDRLTRRPGDGAIPTAEDWSSAKAGAGRHLWRWPQWTRQQSPRSSAHGANASRAPANRRCRLLAAAARKVRTRRQHSMGFVRNRLRHELARRLADSSGFQAARSGPVTSAVIRLYRAGLVYTYKLQAVAARANLATTAAICP